MSAASTYIRDLELRLRAQGNKSLISTFAVKTPDGRIVQTKFTVQAVVAEEMDDGTIELTFTGYPHGDEGDAELIPNALVAGPATVAAAVAVRDAARNSSLQLYTVTLRVNSKNTAPRRPGRDGIPGRWTPFQRTSTFVAMQRLIDDGISPGPKAASEMLGRRPGDHHNLLREYKKHRGFLAVGNVGLLERTVAAYAIVLRSRGRVARDGYAEARRRLNSMLTAYARSRRARAAGE